MLLAHVSWFEDARPAADWSFATSWFTLALLAGAVAAVIAMRLAARVVPGIDVPFLARLAPWMPFAIRLHLAVSLLGLLGLGAYLSPAMDLDWSVAGVALGAVMAIVAVGMATGWHAREAGWLLVAAGPLGMLEYGWSPVLQRVDLLGLALFVVVAGPGRWSADHERGAVREPDAHTAARAMWFLRMLTGVALIVGAFAEKLAVPDLALRFLAANPDVNALARLGLDVGDETFVRFAGCAEVLLGLLLISGALPQLAVLAVGVPFNASLFLFGSVELIGHLPVYGAMLALLVYGSDPRMRALVADPWPFRARRAGTPLLRPGGAKAGSTH